MTEETNAVPQQNKEPRVSTPPQKTGIQALAVPISIVIAGGLVAVAVFFGGGINKGTVITDVNEKQVAPPALPKGSTDAVNKVTTKDHIKGSFDAPVKIVEYSDMECPFCKRFHGTLNQIIDKYGEKGEVAWVFRQFPLDQLHPKNARIVAVTSECATEQGGNDMFWKFTDRWFELTATNDRTDLTTVLPKIYSELGLDQNKIEACVKGGKYDQHVQDDFDNAVATGGRGTPWSVVIGADGKTYPLNGSQPLVAIEQLIGIAKGK